MKTQIYHNPRCSKSRQTLQLLEDNNIDADIVEYLQNPPNAETLNNILTQLGIEPRQLMRTKEAEYKKLGLDNPELDRASVGKRMPYRPRTRRRSRSFR